MKNPSWTRHNLQESAGHWIHCLTTEEANEIRHAAPSSINAIIQTALLELESGHGVYLFRDFPLLADIEDQKAAYLRFGEWMGQPVSQDRQGSKIVDIRKTQASLDEAIHYKAKSSGQLSRPYETSVAFSCHADPCDVAGLLCLQNAATGGETLLVSAVEVLTRLERSQPDLAHVLSEPFPYARPGKEGSFHAIPVISWCDGFLKSHIVPELIFLSQGKPGIPALTAIQKSALVAFTNLCRDPELVYTLTLKPGDLLLVNNHIVLHGRNQYHDNADPRHLLRLWLSVSNSRPLDPIHANWFGSSEAGAIRGGYGP